MYRRYFVPGMEPYISPGGAGSTNTIHTQLGLGFPQRAGGIDPETTRFRPRRVGVVDIRNDF